MFRLATTTSLLTIYLLAGLWPLSWEPPKRVHNGASLTPSSGLKFASPGCASYRGDRSWINRARDESQLALRLRIRSGVQEQLGPARIFSISDGVDIRDLTLCQFRNELHLRLRTVETSANAIPEVIIRRVFDQLTWIDVEVLVEGTQFELRVDDVTYSQTLPPAPLRNWDTHLPVGFGNETSLDRPWVGEIALAEVRTGASWLNLLDPATLAIAPQIWQGVDVRGWEYARRTNLDANQRADIVINFFGFIPWGAAAFGNFGARRSQSRRHSPNRRAARSLASGLRWSLFWSAVLSFAIEFCQIAIPVRVPSLMDLLLNISGGLVGGLFALILFALISQRESSEFKT